ncbi:thiamine pyrophosphate-binding protein [Nocardia sp. CA-128927]|uniref:thiamine pyrophosphate-binding protein n=1 Tax=Nocardia sp. CA-128927 TaxID=3239975 RepID=UPI003D95C6EB
MIEADELVGGLVDRGVVDFVAVPCSYLTPLINRVASASAAGYLPVTHEGEAVAIAAGCWLAGATACVVAQNSGLGNMVNPLTSLTYPSRIPVPLINCADLAEFTDAVKVAQVEAGPTFIYLKIRPGSIAELGRPAVTSSEVARRFRAFVCPESQGGPDVS